MSNPESSDTQTTENIGQASAQTDFEALARFLMGPFLDKPEELKFHVEKLAGGKKLWLRAAFNEEEDKGRVFGRGGRNIKAMRNVMMAAAKQSDITVNLNVFGEPEPERSSGGGGRGGDRGGDRSRGRGSGGSRGRGRGGDRNRPPRASTNPAPPKKKPKPQ